MFLFPMGNIGLSIFPKIIELILELEETLVVIYFKFI